MDLETVQKQPFDKNDKIFLGIAFSQKGDVLRSFLQKASPKTFMISGYYQADLFKQSLISHSAVKTSDETSSRHNPHSNVVHFSVGSREGAATICTKLTAVWIFLA
ncbi:hypothetical protein [Novacetimonas cocois]|uniref:hypothetical protein n=1 Tax=Novacetimonas cocois TaxID=1747507 RepID=UPI001403CE40|nr:hypothetical protein [Novacetimonas cocois]